MTYASLLEVPQIVSVESDLWCTYAAVRTLQWLDRIDDLPDRSVVAEYLASRRNSDGGYAWSAGMNSDAWATYYCTQALGELDSAPTEEVSRSSAAWVLGTHNGDGGFSMTPGQASDVWATYYSVRTLIEIHNLPAPSGVLDWLGQLQATDGGLTWSPQHTQHGRSDVRACYYAITAWSTITSGEKLPWDSERLRTWLTGRQGAGGGFTFQDGDSTECLWATFRATNALLALGEQPRDRDACVDWVRSRLTPGESFTRWPGYPVQDVWAAFCGIGALRALEAETSDLGDRVARSILSFRIPNGGFTYRAPAMAADVLTTSARVLSGAGSAAERDQMQRWLESCMMPNEDGIMYMPGRGSEVRCTLWALTSDAFKDNSEMLARIGDWLVESLQNPDGGFGYWEGRASDLVSTCAAAEVLQIVGEETGSPLMKGLAEFAASCEVAPGQYANVPGGKAAMRSTMQALRVLQRAGVPDTAAVGKALERHRVRGGGFANEGRRLPDLLSTYEAILSADAYGLPVDLDHLHRFLDGVRTSTNGYSWTPLAATTGSPLADCLGNRLARRLNGEALPPLTVS